MKLKSILLTAVATISLATATTAQVPNYVPTNGLVGWWPFNGNANDESGNGNNGTVNGATLASDRFGVANKAYDFDGSSNYISFPSGSSSSLNIISDLSLSFWIKSSTIQNNGIISFGDNTAGSGGYNVAHLSATNVNNVSFVSNNPSNSWLQTNATFNDNIWNNFVIAQKLDTVRIYKNNSIVFTQTGYSHPISYAGNRVIGTGSQLAYFFDGQIDDIGLWNRALTQQEISDLYNGNICYQTITVTDTLLINMGITGFNPVTYNNTIKIFPNPTNDHITIDYGNFASLNGYQLKIINSLSQQVFQTSITQQSNYLNLTTWGGNGLYFVQIIDPQGNIIDIRKIVLQ